MDKLNILFLASWYPNIEDPQDGNFIRNHAVSVSQYCNVYVIYVKGIDQEENIIFKEQNFEGVTEFITYYKKSTHSIPFISKIIKIKEKLNAYIKTFKNLSDKGITIDLTHVNVFYPSGIFARILKKKYKIPFIVSEHWTKFLTINKKQFSFFEKTAIKQINKKASAICPVSENLKSEMIKFGIDNHYYVVPNVVRTDVFYPAKQKKKEELVRFLHISHLDDEHKNVTGIINTFKRLSLLRKDFKLTISGNMNVEKQRLYAQKKDIPEEIIQFEGSKSQVEVAEAMRKHDVFILFSNYENLPCVISEALVSGIPVISSDVGGVSEMINKKNGILTEAGDEQRLLEKIIYMIKNLSKYIGEEISYIAQEKYSYDKVGKTFYEIYKDILGRK